ncbi:uncharacterized protein LOC144440443 [Glandiceps talaboti]
MLPAIAYVPEDEVIDTFETLAQNMPNDAEQVVDYFESNYIGRPRRHGRRPPRFPITMWNMNSRVNDELPRTNNNIAGWHRRMQANVASHHPNIWRFLNILKREQALINVVFNQMIAGESAQPQRRQYQDSAARIHAIVQDFENRHVLDFLRGIAHNLQF